MSLEEGRRLHPARGSRPREAGLRPLRIEPPSLRWLAELYGTSCVTPWVERDEPPLTARLYELVEQSVDFEVWVIHWPSGGELRWHDHGGSAGALWVVSGELEEATLDCGATRRRTIATHQGIAFGPTYVHDVVNRAEGVATSVHVYSPPMEKMTFFDLGHHGLVVERTDWRTDPAWSP